LVLSYGLLTKSNQTKIAAYAVFIISSFGAGIAYFTGEGAEESVENIQGVIESTIKQHEDFAMFALISLIILGIASALGMYLTFKKSQFLSTMAFVILFISIISFGLVGRTGFLGGKIRHTEINSTTNFNSTQNEIEVDND
jgi:hypothetical protein